MKHQWERQSGGDVRCLACGVRAFNALADSLAAIGKAAFSGS